MTQVAFVVVVLLVVAIAFWRPLRGLRSSVGWDHLVTSGHAFLIVGVLLGFAMADSSVTLENDVAPLLAFVLGWVGFATGMRFELRVLRRMPLEVLGRGLAPAVVAALAVGGGVCLVLVHFGAVPWPRAVGLALVSAAAAASSGPTLAALLRRRRAGRTARGRAVLRMIELSAGLDDMVVVALALFSFALLRPGVEPIPTWSFVLLTLTSGALLGMAIWLFLGGASQEEERLLLGIGTLVFAAGLADWLLVSPAAVGAVAAFVLANLPGYRVGQLLRVIRRVERPAVLILMTMVGFVSAGAVGWLVVPLVVLMTLVRLGAKGWAGGMVQGEVAARSGLRATHGWGFGLVTQGTLGLAVTLTYALVWADHLARTLLIAVAAASVINELVAPFFMLRVLRQSTREA